jgi:hypothetical protein
MSVKLHEVMGAARGRSASLAAEVAGYLVLAAADQVAGAPRATGWEDVALLEDGSVRVISGTPCDDARAERTLRSLLGQLLLEASSVTPALLRAGHKATGTGVDALVRELEAALIPVNRGAARRALSRLYRDVVRARDNGKIVALEEHEMSPAAEAPRPSAPAPVMEVAPVVEVPAPVPVTRVEWPVAEPEACDSPPPPADGLETVIPVYVELSAESPPVAEVEPVRAALPEVPDLDVPPSPSAPPARNNADAITSPLPAVRRAAEAAARAASATPPLGSCVTSLDPPEWPPMEVSEPVPSVLELSGDDATERTPDVDPSFAESAKPHGLPAVEARSEGGLDTVDPPRAQPKRPAPMPTPVMPEAVAPPVSVEPSPVPALIAEQLTNLAFSEPTEAEVELVSPPPVDVYALPRRPERVPQAPPRYAPRKSDVDQLLSGFSVASEGSDRELCGDLKALAGVDATRPPPDVELCETPPPVAVAEREDGAPIERDAGERGTRRIAGVVTAALAVLGVGFGSAAARQAPATEAAPAAAALPAPIRTGEVQREMPCAAELTVRRLPPGARARLRAGPDGAMVSPSRVLGDEAVFEALPCREAVEISVEMPSRGRWLRVPVRGEDLAPSEAEPSLVRHSVTVR